MMAIFNALAKSTTGCIPFRDSVVQVFGGVRLDDDHDAAGLVPSPRTCLHGFAARSVGVVFGENVKTFDAGQHREVRDAGHADERPDRPQSHLPAAQTRLDALADAKAMRHTMVGIDLDAAAAHRAEAHPESFFPLRLIAVPLGASAVR
jgi:hypothetical protein